MLSAFGAAASLPFATVTVVLDFHGPRSQQSIEVMKRETEDILKHAGLRLDWKLPEEAQASSFSDLVVVRFKGACVLEPQPYLYDELGPLAYTYATDGAVQPFSEVACDKISAFLQSEGQARDSKKADQMMGKALGRVLAHELVHMLTGSGKHSHGGVFKAGLSAEELTAGELPLDRGELERLRAQSPPARP